MKLLLTILACLVAASAGAQTIKSLGYNTTNGNIVAATNVTFTNSVGFATNARAATRTNLGGTTVGNAVFTATNEAAARTAISAAAADGFGVVSNAYKAGILVDFTDGAFGADALSYADGVWAVSNPTNFRTAIGLGASNNVVFNSLQLDGVGLENDESGFFSLLINTNFSGIKFVNGSTPMFTVTATSATFATNVSVAGSLTATGNATLNGVGNTAPSQTASSGSSLMTRDLSDDRYRVFYVPLVHALTSTAANGSTWNLRPFHSSDAVFSVPPWARNVRVYLSTGFTNAPVSNNFTASITAFQLTTSNSFGIPWGTTTNAFSVTSVWSNGSNSHRFIFGMTNDIALPSGGIADAESANFWNILIQLRNDSSASLTTVPDNWLRGMAVFTD